MNRIRSKFDVLSWGFNASKCKTALKLAVARIKLLKNKREVQVKQMRRELAKLLEAGQEQTAQIRVEHVMREEKTMIAYDLIETYCELIVARLPVIESQKSCPIDLKEAISSVIFASPRCVDIEELVDVRKQFVAKYGKEFINSALEVQPDCRVNHMMIEKLSTRAPDFEVKIKTLSAIAQEHNIKWDSKAFQEQLHKTDADLLNGPNSFGSASKMAMDSYHASFQSVTNQKNGPTLKSFQNDVSSTSQYESRGLENRPNEEFKRSSSRKESDSLDQPVWNMEFKDAASAAEAAAESAERASMAARAAVQLATRGDVSRKFSNGAHKSTYEDEVIRSQEMNPHAMNLPRDEVSPRRETHASFSSSPFSRSPSHSSRSSFDDMRAGEDEPETSQGMKSDGQNLPSRMEIVRSSSHSSVDSIDDNVPEVKAYGHAQREASELEPENIQSGWWNTNEGNFGSHEKQPVFKDDSAVVFDDYGSDTEYVSVFGRGEDENVLDSHLPNLSSFEHSDVIENIFLPSKCDDNLPPTFDFGLSSESEGEMADPPVQKSKDTTWKSYGSSKTPRDSIHYYPDEEPQPVENESEGIFGIQSSHLGVR